MQTIRRPRRPLGPWTRIRTAGFAALGVAFAFLGAAAGARAETVAATPAATPPAFAVDVRGDGDRHVLLIPGLGGPAAVWDDAVDALVADGFRTHAVTLAGFAGQPALPTLDPGSFLPRVHDALLDYVRGLGRPTALVGHSLGAVMSYWLASSAPELFGPVVAVDGVPFLPALLRAGATAESARLEADGLHAMISAMSPAAYDRQAALTLTTMVTDADDARRLAELSRGADPASIAEAMRDLMTRDLRPRLADVTSPLLLIAAGAPAATAEAAAELEARYRHQIAGAPDARVVVLPRARHFVMVDEPERFLALTREHLTPSGSRPEIESETAPEAGR